MKIFIIYNIFIFLTAAGCLTNRSVRVLDRVPVENRELSSLGSADATQASLRFNPASVGAAMKLEKAGVLDRMIWPGSIREQLRAMEREGDAAPELNTRITTLGTSLPESNSETEDKLSSDSTELLDPLWITGRMRSQRLTVDDRTFYFMLADPEYVESASIVTDPDIRSFLLIALEEGMDTPPAMFATEGEPPVIYENVTPRLVSPFAGPGNFAAVPWKGGIAVIYRDRGGIYARRLNIRGEELSFSQDCWQIAEAPDTIARYQLLAHADTRGTVHLLWAIEDADDTSTLHYCRLIPEETNGCQEPVLLTENVAVSESMKPVNLMVQDDHVYISWTDTRFTSGVWTRKNYAKLLIAASHDGGQTFNRPVSINHPKDNSNQARYAITIPVPAGGIMVFWTEESIQGGRWKELPFYTGWLDPDLETLSLGSEQISGESIYELIWTKALSSM